VEPSGPGEDVDAPRRDVIFTFRAETWADSRRRGYRPPDRLVNRLLVDPRVGRLLVADPFRDVLSLLKRRIRGRTAPPPSRPETELFSPVRLRRRHPTGVDGVRGAIAAYERRLRRAAERAGLATPAVITTEPLLAGLGDLGWAGPVTYYARDDWSVHDITRAHWDAHRAAVEGIRGGAVRVVAVSEVLRRRLVDGDGGLTLPNGIDEDEWNAPGSPPAGFAALRRPLFLYTGVVNDRVDATWLGALSERRAGRGTTVLLGPVEKGFDPAALAAIPDVVLHPAVGRAELTGAVRAADVCLVPHVRSPLTEAMSPLKLYEYVAAGRPVVSTDLEPVRGVHRCVHLAGSAEEFAELVDVALREGPLAEADRLAFVAANSWSARHDRLITFALA
jgi:glycosyltransferase involved in cell wall biosynthesis